MARLAKVSHLCCCLQHGRNASAPAPSWMESAAELSTGLRRELHWGLHSSQLLSCLQGRWTLREARFFWISVLPFSSTGIFQGFQLHCQLAIPEREAHRRRGRLRIFISNNCASKLNLAFLSPLVFFQLYPSAVSNLHCGGLTNPATSRCLRRHYLYARIQMAWQINLTFPFIFNSSRNIFSSLWKNVPDTY